MKKEETALILARAKADFEVIEIDNKDLAAVTSGLARQDSSLSATASNGNCGCAAGSTYSGTPTNGNCGCGN